MDWTLEVMVVPVNDVDRAIPFYRDQLGFALDHDTRAGDQRFAQLTPTPTRTAPNRAARSPASNRRCCGLWTLGWPRRRADGRILSSRSTFWRPLLALSRQAWVWGKLNPDTAIPAGGGQPAGGAI
jgi:hypothetical protein